MPKFRLVPLTLVVSIALAACGGDDSSGDSSSDSTNDSTVSTEVVTTDPAAALQETPEYEAPTPTLEGVATAVLEGPITEPGKVVIGVGDFDGSKWGYDESEFFVSGEATSYTSAAPLSTDGLWTVEPFDTAAYKTRLVVRRPADPSLFNGTVFVEWLNVTAGLDVAPVWSFGANEIMRTGAIWVGVSAQRVGVEGGGNPMGSVRVLKIADPARYGTLNHPGDNYSYDMFSQAGATVWREAATLFDGLEPERVIALGESQSAFRMTTYVNALAPTHDVFHAYLVHSRGSRGAQLSSDPGPDVPGPDPAQIRGDLERPVLVFSAETDVVGDRLGYRRADQPDTQWFRSWEVAGTAHADAYSLGIGDNDDGAGSGDQALFDAMLTPPQSVYLGLITCDLPINTGPHTYVIRAALRTLVEWVRTGEPPASQPKLQTNADLTGYELDANGNALGGIRTPQVDAPVAVISGLGQSGESFCGLFGSTRPFSADELAALYTDGADFAAKWNEAVDRAEAAGTLLPEDAEALRGVADRYPLD